MTKIIDFINYSEYDNLLPPVPAKQILPEWYKKIQPYFHKSYKDMTDAKGNTNSTVKKCMPVFDAITSGYLFLTSVDIEITKQSDGPYFTWPMMKPISFHHYTQVKGHPNVETNQQVPKIESAWGYKTPKGYSCLFVPPSHRDNIIKIMPGVVDTDTYNTPVHFPFVLNNPDFEGVIPKGTPIAQIIPFKRDKWEHNVIKGNKITDQNTFYTLKSVFVNAYRNNYWNRKEYK